MKKWQDFKEELEIVFGLYIYEPIMIVFEIFQETIDKFFKRKKVW